MSLLRNVNISAADSPLIDPFGRLRVSEPFTIFDSKQIIDNLPLQWDDSEVSGTGTGSNHSVNLAATTISVSNATAGKRVRQTFRRFNYEPGKGQLVLLTFSDIETESGNTKIVGIGDDNNGLFLVSSDGELYIRRRSYVTGSAVDTDVAQASWNKSTVDELDPSKANIFFIDFEWLGVGRVRTGFVINGLFVVAHEFLNANNLSTVYMSTPNLPLRYSIENDGTGAADSFGHICSSVISEGGVDSNGKTTWLSLSNDIVNANTVGTYYAIKSLRLKTTGLEATVDLLQVSLIALTPDAFEWRLILNPTLANPLSWSDVTNFAVQEGDPDTSNNPSNTTVTGGTVLDGGYVVEDGSATVDVKNVIRLGSAIDGTRDEIVLAVTPLGANLDITGGFVVKELS
jgi:hypothetical protein